MSHIPGGYLNKLNEKWGKALNEKSRLEYALKLILENNFPGVNAVELIDKIKKWDDLILEELKKIKNNPI